MIKHSATIRKRDLKNKATVFFHKFMRFTKDQKTFVLYLFAIGNTITLSNSVTSTISLTTSYYFTRMYLLGGLIFCLYSVVKAAKSHSGKTKIINVIDEHTFKDIDNKKSLHGLFDHDSLDDEHDA